MITDNEKAFRDKCQELFNQLPELCYGEYWEYNEL